MPFSRPASRAVPALVLSAAAAATAACASSPRAARTTTSTTSAAAPSPTPVTATAPAAALPAGAAGAAARLAASPRHGEYAMIKSGDDSVRAWVVFPERATKAPVVVVVHEIFGLSTWVRAVADQLAADGFIAVAPDLLTGYVAPGAPDSVNVAAIRGLDQQQVQRRIAAAGAHGMGLAAAEPRYGVVGFCWGGTASFRHAIHAAQSNTPGYGASVVYYGSAPAPAELAQAKAPILGLFGGNDARVNATLPAADSVLKANGRMHTFAIFGGAGHGFLRQQDGAGGANLTASQQAWPQTVAWFRQHLSR